MHAPASILTSGNQHWFSMETKHLSGFAFHPRLKMPLVAFSPLRNPVKSQPRQTQSPPPRHLSLDNIPHAPTGGLWNKMWDLRKWFEHRGSSRPLSALLKNSPADPGAGYPWDGGHSQFTLCRCCLRPLLYFCSVTPGGVHRSRYPFASPGTTAFRMVSFQFTGALL